MKKQKTTLSPGPTLSTTPVFWKEKDALYPSAATITHASRGKLLCQDTAQMV